MASLDETIAPAAGRRRGRQGDKGCFIFGDLLFKIDFVSDHAATLAPPTADKMVMTEQDADDEEEAKREKKMRRQSQDPNKTMLPLTNDNYNIIMKICEKGTASELS